eukprot:GFYU01008562.1.p1 GENE.GFYU01008562.1~~GFYU01008562.1.p1  ORF type:complete len:534 (-),score=142.55 GFYU01008562.1:660-2261(-)
MSSMLNRLDSGYTGLKAKSEARDAEEKRVAERKKNTMVLVLRHLFDYGYLESVERLEGESGVSLSKADAADNVDLISIVQEYEEYYEFKFGKKPKLVRKADGSGPEPKGGRASTLGKRTTSSAGSNAPAAMRRGTGTGVGAANKTPGKERPSMVKRNSTGDLTRKQSTEDLGVAGKKTAASASEGDKKSEASGDVSITGTSVTADKPPAGAGAGGRAPQGGDAGFFETRLLKPLAGFAGNQEMMELAATIQRDIFTENPEVYFKDIAELTETKQLLKEAVVLPMKYPQFFTGLLQPWKGVLMFGPPGTGKTMLAKAVATECNTTFFNISASSIVSKWRGDSEKLVRVLFELARYHAPSTIFLDEIDALMTQRDGAEHEASRRMKTELLVQMDGIAKTNDLVFVLAASNMPWDLDQAMLRRLEKRIHVPLPTAKARATILKNYLGERCRDTMDFGTLANDTEGYSGADVVLVCKEAAMRPVRRMIDKIEGGEENPPQEQVEQDDITMALQRTRPSATLYLERYRQWADEFGASL